MFSYPRSQYFNGYFSKTFIEAQLNDDHDGPAW